MYKPSEGCVFMSPAADLCQVIKVKSYTHDMSGRDRLPWCIFSTWRKSNNDQTLWPSTLLLIGVLPHFIHLGRMNAYKLKHIALPVTMR